MLTRRTLLRYTATVSAGVVCSPTLRAFAAVPSREIVATTTIALNAAHEAPSALPADFIGLGYEMSSVAPIGLLSPGNTRYVRLVRQLGRRGVLRVGGIVADYTRYDPDGTPLAEIHNTVITRASVEQFAAFLKKLNWTAIWSVNFAQGTIAEAVSEAVAVHRALGNRLQAFEIGNEVENYARGKSFRKAPYTYEQYRSEYTAWRAAILKAVPTARFAAPDTAAAVEWVERMARDSHGDVQLLTTHYYRNGQQQGSAEQLKDADPKLLDKLVRLRAATRRSGIPWRMCEANSFSGGGRPDVSDTLLGALWTLDFLCILARYGCSGVNIETGVNQLGFVSCYSPIEDDSRGNNTAGVPYYGMLAFAMARAGCAESIALDLLTDHPALTAYAFGNSGKVRSVVLVNRGSDPLDVSTATMELHTGSVLRLTGPTSDSKNGIAFGGAAVEPSGHWSLRVKERLTRGLIHVDAMSAAVIIAV